MVKTRLWVVLAAVSVAVFAVGCDGGAAPADGKKTAAKKGSGEFVPGQSDKAPKAVDTTKVEFKGAAVALPKPDSQKKYTLVQGPDYYTEESLFEIIDGASAGYIDYGIKQMVKGVYKPTAEGPFKEEINIEIYRFKDTLGAFGKYGQERSQCIEGKGMADNWCLRQSDLIFWKGDDLVKVQTFDDTPQAEAAIIEIAKMVDGAMPAKADLPALFGKFPTDKRVAGGGGYSSRAMYGFAGLKNVFLMAYRPDGEAYKNPEDVAKLFAADLASEDEANKLFESVRKTAEGQSGVKEKGGIKPIEGAGDGAFLFSDNYGTHTFFKVGKIVAGGRDFKDDTNATEMTKALFGGLSK